MDPDFQTKVDELFEKHRRGVVVGLKEVTGNVAIRQEIDTLLKYEEDTFNLFILAFKELKNKGDQNIMGYFQIAGIHGYPLTPWNGVTGKKEAPDAGNRPNSDGYCPHSKNTFPTWHRPYLVMLEQALFLEMVGIAVSYEDKSVRSKYIAAAKKFRLPYWDYWRPRGGPVTFPGVVGENEKKYQTSYPFDYSVPRIFTDEMIMVKMHPSNELKPIKNPFWHFIFSSYSGSLQDNEWKYMDTYKKDENLINRSQTTRHPFPVPHQNTIQDVVWDNPLRMNSVLNEMRMDATRIALKMLSKSGAYSRYELFCCTTNSSQKDPGEVMPMMVDDSEHENMRQHMTTSLEGIHNMYHIMIGGLQPGGHMSRVPTSAFDPIFWFHHNQIERIFAIWQSIHKGEKAAWFDKKEDAEGDLTPFLSAPQENGFYQFWNSETVKSTETFGYTYQDILGTPDETIRELQRRYGWSVAMVDTKTRQVAPKEFEPLDLSDSIFFRTSRPQISALLSAHDAIRSPSEALEARIQSLETGVETTLSEDTTTWEWEISDQVQRLALNGSFAILYFVLQKDDARLEYESPELAPTLAGMTSVFASPTEGCANCRKHGENAVVMRNAVPITSQLMDYVASQPDKLKSLAPEDVMPFLKKRLRWRITDVNGDSRDPRKMSEKFDFQFNVLSYKSTIGQRNRGEYPDPEPHPEIFREIIQNASEPTYALYVDI